MTSCHNGGLAGRRQGTAIDAVDGGCKLSAAASYDEFGYLYGVSMKILVRNLSRETTEQDVLDMLQTYGAVQYCKLVIDHETGKSKGFGFAEMPRAGEAKAAIKQLNGREVDGNKIRVKKAEVGKKQDD